MGARYATAALQTPVESGFKTIAELLGGTGLRFRLYDVLFGQSGTPADNAMVHDLIRITASGTGTAIVPEKLDPADVAAVVTAKEDNTVEPTTTGIALIKVPLYEKATSRWVAAPGSEIVVAAVANEGLAWRVKAASYTAQAEATLLHEE